MRIARHAGVARVAVLAAMLTCAGGCLTTLTVQRAEGYTYTTEKGESVDLKPQPNFYLLVPFALPADVVLYPLWCFWGWGRIAAGLPPD